MTTLYDLVILGVDYENSDNPVDNIIHDVNEEHLVAFERVLDKNKIDHYHVSVDIGNDVNILSYASCVGI